MKSELTLCYRFLARNKHQLWLAWLLGLIGVHAESVHHLAQGDVAVEIATDTGRLAAAFGPRFDRTAMVTSVRVGGREFLDPRGLPDEFGLGGTGVLGFVEAPVGGEFIKIGVGRLKRENTDSYKYSTPYPISEEFSVVVRAGKTQVTVNQESSAVAGYHYAYQKTYALGTDASLEIRYQLANTGAHSFAIEQYNHNFFLFQGSVAGPNYAVTPEFDLPGDPPTKWRRDGKKLRLSEPAPERGGTYWGVDLDVRPGANRVTLAHPNGQRVECIGDFTATRFAVWSVRTAICPEVFFRANLAPGETVQWTRTYRFGVVGTPKK